MHAIVASDYDETLADGGRVRPGTLAAVARLKASGRRFVLVTGRVIEDLERVFPELGVCDYVVGENGAVLYCPADGRLRPLATAPPPAFVASLRERKVTPLQVGHVVVATRAPQQATVLAAIADRGLELQIVFNKGGVMVLPAGCNKGTGLEAALAELGAPAREVVAVGDAENDHSLLAAAGLPVAVANAVDSLKQQAALVTAAPGGRGVCELIDRLLRDELEFLPEGWAPPSAGEAERGVTGPQR
ncbi:MAG: HAD family phosphatase [Dehalococcoidia bacterium]|nr:HAD family phosphatase [Dehalococcoidia bacterium]